jgi:hypothetical protein
LVKLSKNPCKFPLRRENPNETGSPKTANTTITPPLDEATEIARQGWRDSLSDMSISCGSEWTIPRQQNKRFVM